MDWLRSLFGGGPRGGNPPAKAAGGAAPAGDTTAVCAVQ